MALALVVIGLSEILPSSDFKSVEVVASAEELEQCQDLGTNSSEPSILSLSSVEENPNKPNTPYSADGLCMIYDNGRL